MTYGAKQRVGGMLLCALFLTATLLLAPFSFTNAQSQKVRVVTSQDPTKATLEPIPAGTAVSAALSCESPESLQRYGHLLPEQYKKQAQCATGALKATLLSEKIADAEAALNEIKQRLTVLANTAAYLNSLKNADGLLVVAIPAGKVEPRNVPSATGVALMCLKDPSGAQSSALVGNRASEQSSAFNGLPAPQIEILEKFGKELAQVQKQIDEEVKKNGHISKGTILTLAKKMQALQKLMAENFIPLTPQDINRSYSSLKNWSSPPMLSLGISYHKRPNSEEYLTHPIPGFFKILTKVMGVKDSMFMDGTLSLGNLSFPVWLPDQTMLGEMRASVAAHIKRLEKLKGQFTGALQSFQTELETLKKNDYGCSP